MGRGKKRNPIGISMGEPRRPQPAPDGIISLSEPTPRLTKIFPESLKKSLLKEAPPRLKPVAKPAPEPTTTAPRRSSGTLRGRTVVPTGGITGVVRTDVIPLLTDAGAYAYDDAKFINSSTLVLVSGIQASKWQNGDPKMSSKLKKAKQVGAQVEIVRDSQDFQDILSGQRPV